MAALHGYVRTQTAIIWVQNIHISCTNVLLIALMLNSGIQLTQAKYVFFRLEHRFFVSVSCITCFTFLHIAVSSSPGFIPY